VLSVLDGNSPNKPSPNKLLYSLTGIDSTNVLGSVGGHVSSASGISLSGWACHYGYQTSLNVEVYYGAAKGQGGVLLKTASANLPNEAAVSNACGTSGVAHRFLIPISFSELDSVNGKKFFIHGNSGLPGVVNSLLVNSGAFPDFSMKGNVSALVPTSTGANLNGWACNFGISKSINVRVYAGGPEGQGTLLKSVFASNTNGDVVAAACGTSGSHRFSIPFTSAEIADLKLNGKKLFVDGVAAVAGWPNTLLTGSGLLP
jgi:hypothetical protein